MAGILRFGVRGIHSAALAALPIVVFAMGAASPASGQIPPQAPAGAEMPTGPAPSVPSGTAGEDLASAAESATAPAERATLEEERTALGVVGLGLVSPVTGSEAPNPSTLWGVHGTDLGHMFWHRDRLYMVFGDTFGDGNRHRGRDWRSNVVARLATPNLPHDVLRIESMVSGSDGVAREVIPSRKIDGVERTVIPTNGISTGDRMFLHYMSVRTWHDAGRWDVGHSGLAYSDDDGETWVVPETAVWPTGLGFEQVAFVRQGGHVYSFGIPGGRYGDVQLRRVAEERMLEPAAHEYWNGSTWVGAPEEAAAVVPAPAGELSVAWNARHGQWMMMYLDPVRHAVILRLAPELTGPWGPEQVVVSGEDQPGLYAPYIVPLQDIGDDVWFTMSKWGPYNVFLMRMTLGDMVRTDH